ncbi:hypothetical protein HDU98_007061 [Podochytrium sp. JEL0797]|nr:hypothetical protein HDU98_007061 [Podochytrium sp. JEL0797]
MSDTEPRDRSRSRERSAAREERPRNGRDRRDDSIRSLFVRGLASGTRAEDLTSAFETYGAVKDVYIPRDYYSQGIKGFAYIQYATQEEADKAFDKIEYLTINGRRLTVEWAQGDRKTPVQMRTKDSSGRDIDRRRSPDRSRRDRSSSKKKDTIDSIKVSIELSLATSPVAEPLLTGAAVVDLIGDAENSDVVLQPTRGEFIQAHSSYLLRNPYFAANLSFVEGQNKAHATTPFTVAPPYPNEFRLFLSCIYSQNVD